MCRYLGNLLINPCFCRLYSHIVLRNISILLEGPGHPLGRHRGDELLGLGDRLEDGPLERGFRYVP